MTTVPVTIGLEPIELRPSLLESMSLCPARQRYTDDPRYNQIPSEAMSWGSLQHALIEPNFVVGQYEYNAVRYTSDMIYEVWVANARDKDGFDLTTATSDATLRRLVLEAKDAYEEWSHTVWPLLRDHATLATELHMRHPLGKLRSGRQVFMNATPDHVRQGELDDWKTGYSAYDQGKADSRPQGIHYAWMAEAEFGIPFTAMTYWSYNRKTGYWHPVVQTIEPENIQAAKYAAMEWAGMIESGYYPATPSAPTGKNGRGWWCGPKYCDAWELCDFKGIIADGKDLDEPRERGWPT